MMRLHSPALNAMPGGKKASKETRVMNSEMRSKRLKFRFIQEKPPLKVFEYLWILIDGMQIIK